MRNAIYLGGRLLIIALVAGLAMGAAYYFTKEPIEQQALKASAGAREAVMPGGGAVTQVDASELTGNVSAAFVSQAGGHIVEVVASGYGGGFPVTVGVAADGLIAGVHVGENQETVGLGKNAENPAFTDQFKGKSGDIEVVKEGASANQIDALTGATITARAVADAVNEACAFARALGGAQP